MANKDWYNMGDEIKDIVQQAIDSKNFNRLNQTINDSIRNVTDNIKIPNWNSGSKWTMGDFPYGDKTSQNQHHVERPQAFATASPASNTLTAKTGVLRGLGLALAITGYILAGGIGLAILILLAITFSLGALKAGVGIALSVLFPLLIGSCIMGIIGSKISGRAMRFKKYLRCLGDKTYCNIKLLQQQTGKSHKYILRDLEDMIRREWFLEGHIDSQNTCLIISNETFRQYEELQVHMKEQQILQQEQQFAKSKYTDTLSPDVKNIIAEGNVFLTQIHQSNDAIPGMEISEKISRMELIIRKIFQRVEQEPEVISDLRKMMGYYLPTTIKLLKAYEELDGQPIQGENIISSKKEIERTIDTLNIAFEKLLDSLFKDTAWDVSSDISVLQTMLAQEGLTREDF